MMKKKKQQKKKEKKLFQKTVLIQATKICFQIIPLLKLTVYQVRDTFTYIMVTHTQAFLEKQQFKLQVLLCLPLLQSSCTYLFLYCVYVVNVITRHQSSFISNYIITIMSIAQLNKRYLNKIYHSFAKLLCKFKYKQAILIMLLPTQYTFSSQLKTAKRDEDEKTKFKSA